MPEYHIGVPSWGDGSRSSSVAETVPLEGTSWKHHALEAGGARRLGNESFFSAPQLKRDSLGGSIMIVRFLLLSFLILWTCPNIARGQDSPASLCAVKAVDTTGWVRDTVGPFLIQLPHSL